MHAGGLSPRSGAADLLISVAMWAEQNPERPAEIWWLGEGDMAGVLAAQPLPANVSQRFLGRLDPSAAAAAFDQCGLLAASSVPGNRHAMVAEALAASLPVLGSRRNRLARRLVRDGVNGWLFDPSRPADMVTVVFRALGTPAERLDPMREAARASAAQAAGRGMAQRVRRMLAACVPGRLADLAGPPLPVREAR